MVMKIRKLQFNNNKILSDLELDFVYYKYSL